MPNQVEARYRDFLSDKLDLIESGLSIVDVEMFLPNDEGARGFVDLVARDKYGVLVLIEIKRSDTAARSAMHELFKYVALFRRNHGLGKHQIRCVLLSTEWHELLVPFSELLASAPFELTGRKMTIGSDGNPSGSQLVQPVDLSDELAICPKHQILLYHSAANRNADIARVVAALGEAGVCDFYLVHMDYAGANPRVITPHSLYVVLGELSSAQRAAVQATRDRLWKDQAHAEGEGEVIPEPGDEDYDGLDADSWDHETEVFSRLYFATSQVDQEIGYPDKFRTVFDTWLIVGFTRSGRFTSELVWPDDALISGAISEGGRHTTVFVSQASTHNETAFARLLSNVDYSLMGAKGWRKQVPRLLTYLKSQASTSSVSVHLYSPCDLLWGLAALAKGETGYLPGFEIASESENAGESRFFLGVLEWDGETHLSPSTEIDAIVDGGTFKYHLSRHLGEQWQDEDYYCNLHGLRYAVYELGAGDDELDFWRTRVKKAGLEQEKLTRAKFLAGSMIAFAGSNSAYLDHLSEQLVESYAAWNPF